LLEGLQFYFTAFFDLDRERGIGLNGREPIRGRAIREYAEDEGMDREQYERLQYLITEMDDAFLKRLAEKRPSPPQGKRK